MKFDYIVGNPPYQEEAPGTSTSDKPIYHLFMDETYKLSNKVELITPGRFLFNAGATPSAWNERMLNDKHLKVIWYEQDSSKLFPNTDIKGGVAVTYRNIDYDYKGIGIFLSFRELNSLLNKVVKDNIQFQSISKLVVSRTAYRFTDELHKDYPNAIYSLSKGHAYDVSTNIFEKLPMVFKNKKVDDEYISILGREKNQRVYKYIKRKYINNVSNFESYKVILPKSNGSGALGEALTTPLIGEPLIGNTESFISIGKFDNKEQACNCLKYIKSKFARCMLGILKITQDNPPEKWKYVPLQDFTENSDIDWSKSIPEIDQQLYKKYGLDKDEIEFIETHVKPMT